MITIIARVSEIIKAIKAKISHHESQNDDVLNREQEEAAFEKAVDEFRRTVDILASLNGFAGLAAIDDIKGNAHWIVGEGLQQQYYAGLMRHNLVGEDPCSRTVYLKEVVAERRAIPLTALLDRELFNRGFGHAVSVFAGNCGVTIRTSRGYTISVPECKTFFSQLNESWWMCAYEMIEHITNGAIKLSAAELLGKTDEVFAQLHDHTWTVNTGIPATSS